MNLCFTFLQTQEVWGALQQHFWGDSANHYKHNQLSPSLLVSGIQVQRWTKQFWGESAVTSFKMTEFFSLGIIWGFWLCPVEHVSKPSGWKGVSSLQLWVVGGRIWWHPWSLHRLLFHRVLGLLRVHPEDVWQNWGSDQNVKDIYLPCKLGCETIRDLNLVLN